MAWRLNQSVVRGEIDNRIRGSVTGRIWIVEREFPIVLQLKGNPWRDMAGCLLAFENPHPRAADDGGLSPIQMGRVGDITASRKSRILEVSVTEAMDMCKRGEPVPEHMSNVVYIEWYSRANGRVVLELADFQISISPHAWRMTADDERKQRETNARNVVRWVDRLTSEFEGVDDELYEQDWEMDEFEWEKQLKESDAMTERYSELMDMYMDHPDRENIIAREMGWSWYDEDIDAGLSHGESDALDGWAEVAFDDFPDLEPNPLTEGIDWIRNENGDIKHPLSAKAHRVSFQMWRFCQERGLLEDEEGDPDLHDMLCEAQILSAKLAGALDSLAYDDEPDCGFVIACLKRSLKYFENAVRAASLVATKNCLPAQHISTFRDQLFEIRQDILGLMTHYRQYQ